MIDEYAEKNSICAVPGPVSRLMDAEQIVLTDVNNVVEDFVLFLFVVESFDRKGILEMGL